MQVRLGFRRRCCCSRASSGSCGLPHGLRSRRQQASQIAQSCGCGRLLVKLQPDLQVAPFQIELGYLVLLQKFNQLF